MALDLTLSGMVYADGTGNVTFSGTSDLFGDVNITINALQTVFTNASSLDGSITDGGGPSPLPPFVNRILGAAPGYADYDIDGVEGMPGLPGRIGADGVVGQIGLPGVDGEEGLDGLFGPQGRQGDKGYQGLPGIESSEDGLDGLPGTTGQIGIQGLVGVPGIDGEDSTLDQLDNVPYINAAILARFLGYGTNGQALVVDGLGSFALGTVGGGSGGALVFKTSATVTGAAATNLTVSGLDLDTDGRYFILITLKNNTASNANINFFYNADTTGTNYDEQRIAASSTTISGTRANDAFLIPLPASSYSAAYFWLFKDQNTKPTLMHLGIADITTVMTWRSGVHQWRTTATNVTSFVVNSSVASALAVGCVAYVWKNTIS